MKMENGNIVAKDNRGSRRRAVSYVMTIGSERGFRGWRLRKWGAHLISCVTRVSVLDGALTELEKVYPKVPSRIHLQSSIQFLSTCPA